MDSGLHGVCAKFWPDQLNVAANWDPSDQPTFVQCSVVQYLRACVVSISSSKLTGVAPAVVSCCCSPSSSRLDALCCQRWYSSSLGCNRWLFRLLSVYHLPSRINKAFLSTHLLFNPQFLFFGPFPECIWVLCGPEIWSRSFGSISANKSTHRICYHVIWLLKRRFTSQRTLCYHLKT